MSRPPRTRSTGQPAPAPKRRPAARPARPPARAARPDNGTGGRWRPLLWACAEAGLLAVAGMVATITTLGRAAGWFGGSGLTDSLLPFAGTVLLLAMAGSVLLWLWLHLRRWVRRSGREMWPALAALMVALVAVLFAFRAPFLADLRNLRTLVGGVAQAGRDAIGHQVYANYRRANLADLQTLMTRAQPHWPLIREAAAAFRVDAEVMVGIGAAESSFVARDSQDGGRGVFQITAPPKAAQEAVRRTLGLTQLDYRDTRQNAYLAAATLRHYLDEMNGDLFLGLLAYNIGPRNGGLLSIMQQYGARDFFTIQPYLQHLPRDYPIRVLTAALAFRLWTTLGALPAYEEGENARVIQGYGIPGLDW